jgi:hypothetical protein
MDANPLRRLQFLTAFPHPYFGAVLRAIMNHADSDAESHTSSVDTVPSSRRASDEEDDDDADDSTLSDAEGQDEDSSDAASDRCREDTEEQPAMKGPCFEGCGWWCRGCTRGLDWLPEKMGISGEERERIYTLQFAGCGELFVPCIACNKDGRRPPNEDDDMDGSTLPDFWKGFEVNYAPEDDPYSEYVRNVLSTKHRMDEMRSCRAMPWFTERANAATRERVYERIMWKERYDDMWATMREVEHHKVIIKEQEQTNKQQAQVIQQMQKQIDALMKATGVNASGAGSNVPAASAAASSAAAAAATLEPAVASSQPSASSVNGSSAAADSGPVVAPAAPALTAKEKRRHGCSRLLQRIWAALTWP